MGDPQRHGLNMLRRKQEKQDRKCKTNFQGITMFYKRLNVNKNKTMAMAYLSSYIICYKLEGKEPI